MHLKEDWGEKWKSCFMVKTNFIVMNKYLLALIAIVVGLGGVYAISPYFTESSIDEPLPTGIIAQSEMEEKAMMDVMTYSGTFVGVGDGIHDAQGDVYTIPLEDGNNVLRLENFQSTNGPDLYVYLATDD